MLLARAEGQFEVFLTADKNLRYQQNLRDRMLAVIIFPSNKLSVIKPLASRITVAVASVVPGTVIEL